MDDYFQIITSKIKDEAGLIKKYFSIHPGENGRNKEDIVTHFLKSHLPNRYSIGTGFIIDSVSKDLVSNQTDIIIYDSFWSSILFPESVSQFYPIESVFGVIEVKSMLSRTELEETINKAKIIKNMQRKGVGRIDHQFGIDEPIVALFAYDSIDLSLIKAYLSEFYNGVAMEERIDLIVIIGKGIFYTGNYFKITKYGHLDAVTDNELKEAEKLKIASEFPDEIAGLKLGDYSLYVWYLYLMSYLSFSRSKVVNWTDYIEMNKLFGETID